MKKILITGGSGLIGQRITLHLEKKGHEVAWLSRSPKENKQKSFFWDIDQMKIDAEAVEWADTIIHLAGTGVADKRWTADRKQDILQSRTHSTQLIRQAIETSSDKPSAYIGASAIGYYGFDTGDQLMDESSSSGSDFLAQVVTSWEAESKKIENSAIRTVVLRIGIVLDKNGGALVEMLKPPVAAPLGSGKQWMSWIQLEDLARMFVFAVENEEVEGIYNAVGPKPSTNQTLTQEAAKKVNKTFVNIGVPGFILKVMLGEMAQMVLGGNNVSSKKIEGAGFQFRYPDLDSALAKTYSTGGGD
ncbi:TIGR01777 family oxidoreductase [Belliella sp. DSM 111904]|uniref:TIGR01777 family oxidoreductase n=1 Tax=Belliella filtrata TaxID=2923435 RepID=A0ABS9V144_9BACT|nr:TIGR01777 family oxidoreductase [Belliella filtrata]MCH7410142.1 TIGR01777 family oxidoreductase [Belliella filtrata]